MNLTPDSLLFGVSPEILIDCAQQLRDDLRPFSMDEFCKAIGAPQSEAGPVLKQMISEGFVTLDDTKLGQYIPTSKFNQLAVASISNGISRDKADELLLAVVRMAEKVNAQPDVYRYAVECLVVFGSYLGAKPVLGDLDIGVELRELPRERDGARRPIKEIVQGGMSSLNKTMSALRLRKPKLISIHELGEVVALGTEYKVIWGRLPERYSVT